MSASLRKRCRFLNSKGLGKRDIAKFLSVTVEQVEAELKPKPQARRSPFVIRPDLHSRKPRRFMEERGTYLDTEEGKAAAQKYEEDKAKPFEPYDVTNMPKWTHERHLAREKQIEQRHVALLEHKGK